MISHHSCAGMSYNVAAHRLMTYGRSRMPCVFINHAKLFYQWEVELIGCFSN